MKVVRGTNRRHYWVDEAGKAELARCGWLVDRGPTEDGDPWIVECGAQLVRLDDDGWACAAGHEHLTYGTPAQQERERAEALAEHMAALRAER